MSSYIFDNFKRSLMMGDFDLTAANQTYYIALVNTSAFNSDKTDEISYYTVSSTWDIKYDTGYESSGYNAGGSGLSGCTLSAAYGANEIRWDASNITWASSTIDARGAVIYRQSDGIMVCAIDFGSEKTSTNGDFTINWNSLGIAKLS